MTKVAEGRWSSKRGFVRSSTRWIRAAPGVEEGSIGKADRLVSVFAAREMVVTLAGKALPMKENDTLEVFAGAEPPKQRIIRSRTFAENIGALSAYLARHAPPPR